MYQINTVYTLNLHNIIYQLYLNKAGNSFFKKNSFYLPIYVHSIIHNSQKVEATPVHRQINR